MIANVACSNTYVEYSHIIYVIITEFITRSNVSHIGWDSCIGKYNLVYNIEARTKAALVQVKACRLFGAKPLLQPILAYCKVNP